MFSRRGAGDEPAPDLRRGTMVGFCWRAVTWSIDFIAEHPFLCASTLLLSIGVGAATALWFSVRPLPGLPTASTRVDIGEILSGKPLGGPNSFATSTFIDLGQGVGPNGEIAKIIRDPRCFWTFGCPGTFGTPDTGLSSLKTIDGLTRFDAPKSMSEGDTSDVEVSLATDQLPESALKAAIAAIRDGLDKSAPRQSGTRAAEVSGYMTATLDGAGFTVSPKDAVRQKIRDDKPTTWVWQITAESSGDKLITVTLNAELTGPVPSRMWWK